MTFAERYVKIAILLASESYPPISIPARNAIFFVLDDDDMR